MGQDYERALTFMTPGYQSGPRAERFRGDFGGASFWQNAEIKWVKCDQENSPPAGQADDGIAVAAGSASNADRSNSASGAADDCVVNVGKIAVRSWPRPFLHRRRCRLTVTVAR